MIGDTANEERMFVFYYSQPLSKQNYIDYLLYIARDKGLLVSTQCDLIINADVVDLRGLPAPGHRGL